MLCGNAAWQRPASRPIPRECPILVEAVRPESLSAGGNSELICAEDWKAAARLLAAAPSAGTETARRRRGQPQARNKGQWLEPPLSPEERQAWRARLAASSHWPDLLDDLLALWVCGAAPFWKLCALCLLPGVGHRVAMTRVCHRSPCSERACLMQSMAGLRATVAL